MNFFTIPKFILLILVSYIVSGLLLYAATSNYNDALWFEGVEILVFTIPIATSLYFITKNYEMVFCFPYVFVLLIFSAEVGYKKPIQNCLSSSISTQLEIGCMPVNNTSGSLRHIKDEIVKFYYNGLDRDLPWPTSNYRMLSSKTYNYPKDMKPHYVIYKPIKAMKDDFDSLSREVLRNKIIHSYTMYFSNEKVIKNILDYDYVNASETSAITEDDIINLTKSKLFLSKIDHALEYIYTYE
jgi:hypothetical protein